MKKHIQAIYNEAKFSGLEDSDAPSLPMHRTSVGLTHSAISSGSVQYRTIPSGRLSLDIIHHVYNFHQLSQTEQSRMIMKLTDHF